MRKKIEVRKTPLFPKPLAKSAIVVYNQVRNRRILACPTVTQSETYKALSLLTDYRLSSIASRGHIHNHMRPRYESKHSLFYNIYEILFLLYSVAIICIIDSKLFSVA